MPQSPDLTNFTARVITEANALSGDASMRRTPRFGWLVGTLLATLVLAAALAPAALSQTSTGSVRGYVKDQNGQPLGGAEIQARNVAGGVPRTATSLADGSYHLSGLVPGTYDLTARHIGHAAQGRRLAVRIGATL